MTNANPDAAGKRFCLAKTDAGVIEPASPAAGVSATERGLPSLDVTVFAPAAPPIDAGVIAPAAPATDAGVRAVVGRIIGTSIQGSEIIVTIGAGINSGVAKNWTAHVLRGNTDQLLDGGRIKIIGIDKTVVAGKTTLTADQLLANPHVRLSPP